MSISTSAEATYFAQGLLQINENVSLTTRVPTIVRQSVSQTEVYNTTDVRTNVNVTVCAYQDPLAETFLVDANSYPAGVFLDSLDLFFKTKASGLPITVQIRPTVNGYPHSSMVLPFGEVILLPENVNISVDASEATNFKFQAPIYLKPGEYSIVIMSNSNEYEVFIAELGELQLNSANTISSQPYSGSFFISQNSSTWQPEQQKDLMFRLNQCVFNTESKTVVFNCSCDTTSNLDLIEVANPEFILNDISLSWKYSTSAIPSYTAIKTNQNILMPSRKTIGSGSTNLKLQATLSSSNSDVSPIVDVGRLGVVAVENVINNYPVQPPAIIYSGYGYDSAPSINISGDAVADSSINTKTGQVVAINITSYGSGYDSTPNTDWTCEANPDATGGYGATARISSVGATGNITGIIITSPGYNYPADGHIICSIVDGTGEGASITADSTDGFVGQCSILAGGDGTSYTVNDTLIIPGNCILQSNGLYGETNPSGGNNKARYITRKVTLADKFDANDIHVYIDAYKPSTSDIEVYYKILSAESDELFEAQPYVKMNLNTGDSGTVVYSTNQQDFIEYEYNNDIGGVIQQIGPFKYFAIKIVLLSSSTIDVPVIKNLRVIALDS